MSLTPPSHHKELAALSPTMHADVSISWAAQQQQQDSASLSTLPYSVSALECARRVAGGSACASEHVLKALHQMPDQSQCSLAAQGPKIAAQEGRETCMRPSAHAACASPVYTPFSCVAAAVGATLGGSDGDCTTAAGDLRPHQPPPPQQQQQPQHMSCFGSAAMDLALKVRGYFVCLSAQSQGCKGEVPQVMRMRRRWWCWLGAE
jgi:hypothetical protein